MIFKYKFPPLALLFLFAALMYVSSIYTLSYELNHVIRLIIFAGMLGTAITIVMLSVGKFRFYKTTVNPIKPESASVLVTTGIFSITRNPMYVGFVLALLGWGIYLSNLISLLLVVVFFLYMHYIQIPSEENALVVLFGESYNEYKANVKRWL